MSVKLVVRKISVGNMEPALTIITGIIPSALQKLSITLGISNLIQIYMANRIFMLISSSAAYFKGKPHIKKLLCT